MRSVAAIFVLTTACTCALGQRAVFYGGGDVSVTLAPVDPGAPHGSFQTTGATTEGFANFGEGLGAVTQGAIELGVAQAAMRTSTIASDAWEVQASFLVPADANPLDGCGGEAEWLAVRLWGDKDEADHAVQFGVRSVTDTATVATLDTSPRVTRKGVGTLETDEASRFPLSGTFRTRGETWSSGKRRCADGDLGVSDIELTWAFDPEVQVVVETCKPTTTMQIDLF